jgi:hypothetical protein
LTSRRSNAIASGPKGRCRSGCVSSTGNGTWCISRPAPAAGDDLGRAYVNDEELPKNIRDLLFLEVAWNDHLGFYIRNIMRGEW